MRKKLPVAVCVFTIVVAVALLWPTAGYEIDRVLPQLRALCTPYQSVSTVYYPDGGSIGITITDRDSHTLQLALPVLADGKGKYPDLFVGANHASDTGAVEVVFTEDARRMLIAIIEDHRTAADSSHMALVALRGSPRDYARLAWKAAFHF